MPSRRFLQSVASATLAFGLLVAIIPNGSAATKRVRGLYPANGKAPGPAVAFDWEHVLPAELLAGGKISVASSSEQVLKNTVGEQKLFKLLIIGSDARPKENFLKTRADSLHIFLWNPALERGTLVGIPRDSYVNLGNGRSGKVNGSLAGAGPENVLRVVNQLSGLKIQHYAITGFAGFTKMVNQVGGVNVLVDPAMNDKKSGATFAKGWVAMNGNAALAYSRNRYGVAGGDFDRSLNQGKLLRIGLAKLRSETSTASGLLKWVRAFEGNGATNFKPADLLVFAQLARQMNPDKIENRVLEGKPGMAGKASVVRLAPTTAALFRDLAPDGVTGP